MRLIRRLRQLASLHNLRRKRLGLRGQVATYMLLLITAALIGTLAIANLGQLSINSANATNAADTAVLLLASQLATKSHAIWDSLKGAPDDGIGSTKKCKFGGFLGIILMAIVLIVLIIIAIFVPPVWAIVAVAAPLVAAGIGATVAYIIASMLVYALIGALAGAIAGAAIGGIAGGGAGALMGTFQGLKIGAQVGAAFGAVVAPDPATIAGSAVPAGSTAASGGAGVEVAAPMSSLESGGGMSSFISAGTEIPANSTLVSGSVILPTGETMVPIGTAVPGGAFAGVGGAGVSSAAGPSLSIPAGGAIPAGSSLMSGTMLAIPAGISLAGGTMLGLNAAAIAYNEGYVRAKLDADAMKALAKATNGLGERSRIRESVFFSALTQTVDDPNQTGVRGANGKLTQQCWWAGHAFPIIGDPEDSDGDGDIIEQVPCFQIWWDCRIKMLKGGQVCAGQRLQLTQQPTTPVLQQIMALVDEFLDRKPPIQSALQASYARGAVLSRSELEGRDGILVEVARALEVPGVRGARTTNTTKYPVKFWDPGPTQTELNTWLKQETCEDTEGSCTGVALRGYDELDATVNQLFDLAGNQSTVGVLGGLRQQDRAELTASVESWIGWFYEPSGTDTYYATLNDAKDNTVQIGVIAKLQAWKQELFQIHNGTNAGAKLPTCACPPQDPLQPPQLCPSTFNPPTNFPCRAPGFATIDADMQDEFVTARQQIDQLIAKLGQGDPPGAAPAPPTVRGEFKTFYDKWKALDTQTTGVAWFGRVSGKTCEHFNYLNQRKQVPCSATLYRWTDSRGDHSVKVELPDFRIPHTGVTKHVLKTCTRLRDSSDDSDRTWVKIIKDDPADMQIGGEDGDPDTALWRWNPVKDPVTGLRLDAMKTEQISHALWSFNCVQLTPTPSKVAPAGTGCVP